jgi:thiol-disulfide isomerase/thioredoxin
MAANYRQVESVERKLAWSNRRRFLTKRLVAGLAALAFTPFAQSEELKTSEEDVPSFASGRYQLVLLRPQRELPSIRLFRLDGGTTELSSMQGKPILLNFWATWCPACRTELPILDRLQKQSDGLYVLAVSVDGADRAVVAHFVKELGLRHLAIFRDPNGYVAFSDHDNKKNASFALYGMPITYVIAASGRILGYIPGATDWTSAVAGTLIEFLRSS